MKQMPAFFNPQFPNQQARAMMPPWSSYEPIAQQAFQQPASQGLLSDTSSSSGLLGMLKKLNPSGGGLFETLDKIQGFLKMSQSIAPKIQEYGPLIKNLPTMLALMKEFNEEEEESEGSSDKQSDSADDSTDVLDQILGLDSEQVELAEVKKECKQSSKKVQHQNVESNLFKIETISDQLKPKHDQPMLFI